MNEESVSLTSSSDTSLNLSTNKSSTAKHEEEPFLHFDLNTELSFEDKSPLFNSLVALVKAGYTFDNTLQDRAVVFLKSFRPNWNECDLATNLVSNLVPSSDDSPTGFVDSIVTLLSSPHSAVVAAALTFLYFTLLNSSHDLRLLLVDSDLTTTLLATVQPHTLSISGNEKIIKYLTRIIVHFVNFASPSSIRNFGLITPAETHNHREMIFQKVILPSSQFVTFLISNRHSLNRGLFDSFRQILVTLLRIGPFHRPTLEFVLASPIVMAFSSCLSLVKNNFVKARVLSTINSLLQEWKKEGPEVAQSGKRVMQALFSEGIEDIVEQRMGCIA